MPFIAEYLFVLAGIGFFPLDSTSSCSSLQVLLHVHPAALEHIQSNQVECGDV
jgi:hypothetical protein